MTDPAAITDIPYLIMPLSHPNKQMNDKKSIPVKRPLLVGLGNSTRLAAIRNKISPENKINSEKQKFAKNIKPEVKTLIQQARKLIDKQLDSILKCYPPGKSKTFFKLKYKVDLEKIKAMKMKRLFLLLDLETTAIKNFCLIENLDYKGNLRNE